jgi:hypothetical protein
MMQWRAWRAVPDAKKFVPHAEAQIPGEFCGFNEPSLLVEPNSGTWSQIILAKDIRRLFFFMCIYFIIFHHISSFNP